MVASLSEIPRTGRRLVLWGVLAGAVLLAGCKPGDFGSSHVYFDPIRYRLTAEVETPEGVKTGSSVIEAKTDRRITRVKARGEAVAVDLPDGQVLFVLLRSASMVDWAATLPGIPLPEDDVSIGVFKERQAQLERQLDAVSRDRTVYYLWGGTISKDRAQYLPYMVRFRDMADPKSVEQVDPADLAKSFGPGVKLKSLTVQVTDEPMTKSIEKRLRWLGEYPEPHLAPIPGGGVATPTMGQFLTHGDFRKDKHQ